MTVGLRGVRGQVGWRWLQCVLQLRSRGTRGLGNTGIMGRHGGTRQLRDEVGGWCNGYYGADQGLIGEYLMSGAPSAFDRAAEEVLHQIDVDQCHWTNDAESTFLGGMWGGLAEGADHSKGRWMSIMYNARSTAGWAHY